MNPIFTRVDSRLIHGTIVENWVNYLGATAIVVANDEIIGNNLRLTVLEMAVPPSVRFGIYTLKVATKKILEGEFEKERAILLFSNIRDVYTSINYGLNINLLNLGDYQSEEADIKLSDRVILGKKDIECLKTIAKKGISIFVQTLPCSKSINIDRLLE